MRTIVFIFMLTCGLPALGRAFTLQSYARVNLVCGVNVQRISEAAETSGVQLAKAAPGAGPDSRLAFAISGPVGVWAKVTLVDLSQELSSSTIASQEDSSGKLEVICPPAGAAQPAGLSWPALLLRVEYE